MKSHHDKVKDKYFKKDISIDTVRKETISAFMTQESDKFHDFAVDAIDEAVLIDSVKVEDKDCELYNEILNEEYYTEVLSTEELKKKHGIE